jgi:hypothetical protein
MIVFLVFIFYITSQVYCSAVQEARVVFDLIPSGVESEEEDRPGSVLGYDEILEKNIEF